jgi:hypothetical protein
MQPAGFELGAVQILGGEPVGHLLIPREFPDAEVFRELVEFKLSIFVIHLLHEERNVMD